MKKKVISALAMAIPMHISFSDYLLCEELPNTRTASDPERSRIPSRSRRATKRCEVIILYSSAQQAAMSLTVNNFRENWTILSVSNAYPTPDAINVNAPQVPTNAPSLPTAAATP